MKLLFVADPLEVFKPYKDSTFAMMREAASRGHALCGLRAGASALAARRPVMARVRAADAHRQRARTGSWRAEPELCALADFDAVLMRKDPPFDSEYFYATHLLQQAERDGARVFNQPRALRDHPEKLAILEFPEFIGADAGDAQRRRRARLPCRAQGHHPQAAGRHGRHGHLPRRPGRHEPGQHHRDAEPRRRADGDGAALPARDRRGRQAHPGDRRRAGAVLRWRASRRAARSAATWPPAARAWRSR